MSAAVNGAGRRGAGRRQRGIPDVAPGTVPALEPVVAPGVEAAATASATASVSGAALTAGIAPAAAVDVITALLAEKIAGQAAALPIVLERGRAVRERTKDTWGLWRQRALNPESNVQFGEGGAGTFSDGKLYSQIKDPRHLGRKVMEEFVQAGAPPEATSMPSTSPASHCTTAGMGLAFMA